MHSHQDREQAAKGSDWSQRLGFGPHLTFSLPLPVCPFGFLECPQWSAVLELTIPCGREKPRRIVFWNLSQVPEAVEILIGVTEVM